MRKQGRSLSDLVENYLKAITDLEEQVKVFVPYQMVSKKQ